ncbi:phenylalanine--tRNA ligase subunit alpha [Pseudomonadota bacterium]|nr:phenylalanine--tRNA ligase subunit alpha [Pseudomonadota bacterium]|tara:strand:- start:1067 stop:1792 length:726 start_codon:yes stop_codon:yes gene_type:complete
MSSFDDILYPEVPDTTGSYHPIIQAKIFLINMLEDFGFQHVSGPEIENEEFNFDMLNIKKSHPARQMHDTFYLNKKDSLLRTHTSPVQIRTMLNEDPPFAFSSAGKVFRKDDDATHLPMFHQVEGMYVDNNVTFANLKDLIHKIIYHIFDENVEIRFRPSFFPFTEPSAEVDILSENGKWLEILGCGLINPVVLDNCGIDSSKYNGLAFGLGIERIAMLKYGVGDIREFYKSNLDFLNQFK